MDHEDSDGRDLEGGDQLALDGAEAAPDSSGRGRACTQSEWNVAAQHADDNHTLPIPGSSEHARPARDRLHRQQRLDRLHLRLPLIGTPAPRVEGVVASATPPRVAQSGS